MQLLYTIPLHSRSHYATRLKSPTPTRKNAHGAVAPTTAISNTVMPKAKTAGLLTAKWTTIGLSSTPTTSLC